jgi:UDP-2,3-diacylglucosamine hydrolase
VTTLFASDVHLSEERPAVTELFLDFLGRGTSIDDDLYLLGDMFEAWVGDDDLSPLHRAVIQALRLRSEAGVRLHVMPGNRDFLLGTAFAQMAGTRLVEDPSVIIVAGVPTLLAHGDALCTDDVEYQQFRAEVRKPEVQRAFLGLPLEQRRRMGQLYRERSRGQQTCAPAMDVNEQAVAEAMGRYKARRLIHGHIHRPGIHNIDLDGTPATRVVLGDWDTCGIVASCRGTALTLFCWGGDAEHGVGRDFALWDPP